MESIDDLFECFEDRDEGEILSDDEDEDASSERNSSDKQGQKRKLGIINRENVAALKKSKPGDGNDKDNTNKDNVGSMEPLALMNRFKFEELNLKDVNFEELKNRIVIQKIETKEACSHEVAYPPDYTIMPLQVPIGESAKKYPFTLDPFQKESILCLENNQSVLVSAHTSAGKTVIAEYAVALSLKRTQRVIYTTPIKALSNQKYREFLEEFKDVGLVTGDVTISPNASCLIMTTEILRNMLYRGSSIMREVGWVIFDEIHYMRDKERGVVWEETLILLPHNVHFVFLSATIPNARQFAEWVVHLHHQPCHVVYTDYRPTPLQHYLYPVGGSGIHLVVDEFGVFREDNFNAAMAVLQNSDASKGDQRGRRGGIAGRDAEQTEIFKIVKMVMERNFAPVIVFSFSKKDCELYATQMAKLDFNTSHEKDLVETVFNNAIDVLTDDDKHLPQVENLLPLLRRGIGIHHGGLLPILKETVEILFGEGLIKALFATETFAMGLNMPARTVLFTGMKKFDGRDYRWITSGEYIQMSGRAGRRGIDEKGIVILMVDEKLPPAVGREIVKGLPDAINSAFHLSYNMVLNLLRVEEINPEYMLERSFYQFQNQVALPGYYDDYHNQLTKFKSFKIENEDQVAVYYNIRQQLDKLSVKFRQFITKPEYLIPFLQPGRLLKIKTEDGEYDWGAVVNFKKVSDITTGKRNKTSNAKVETKVIIDVLLHVIPPETEIISNLPKPCPPHEKGEVEIFKIDSSLITHISSVRLYCPTDLKSSDSKMGLYKTITTVKKRFPNGNPPLLNPVNDMKIKTPDFLDIVEKIEKLEKRMYNHPMHEAGSHHPEYSKYEQKLKCYDELMVARKKLMDAKSIVQLDELKSRKRVLRRLGYCTDSDVIDTKGRVACELSSADELIITELIFNGVFTSLSPAQSSALLSCFVCDEKSQEMPKLTSELSGPLRQLQDIARRIAKVSNESNLTLEEDAYVERFKPFLMDVVFSWCNGSSFSMICQMTDIYEGSIVRCMRRLEELLRQMVQASKTIGNTDLEDKFNQAIHLIKRDIVFSSSLYL